MGTEAVGQVTVAGKTCLRCSVEKPLADFHKAGRSKDGHSTRCKACVKAANAERFGGDEAYRAKKSEQSAAWRLANPDRERESNRASHLLRNYGLSVEVYDALLSNQAGVCAMCLRPPTAARRLAVEHDHKSGRIHGLACQRDNHMLLGVFGRDPAFYRRVAAFLESPPAANVLGGDHVVPTRKKPVRRRNARAT